jgi:hypothetical protein
VSDDIFWSALIKEKHRQGCLELIDAVLVAPERAMAVFPADAFSYRFLLITDERVLGLDPPNKRNPAKAQKQVVHQSEIAGVTGEAC